LPVPPLKKQVRRLLDPAKHPFRNFSERVLIFGLKKSDQGLGLSVLPFDYLNRSYWEKYDYSEFGWTLEDNRDVNKFVIELGAKMDNKWRIFRKSLTQ